MDADRLNKYEQEEHNGNTAHQPVAYPIGIVVHLAEYRYTHKPAVLYGSPHIPHNDNRLLRHHQQCPYHDRPTNTFLPTWEARAQGCIGMSIEIPQHGTAHHRKKQEQPRGCTDDTPPLIECKRVTAQDIDAEGYGKHKQCISESLAQCREMLSVTYDAQCQHSPRHHKHTGEEGMPHIAAPRMFRIVEPHGIVPEQYPAYRHKERVNGCPYSRNQGCPFESEFGMGCFHNSLLFIFSTNCH